MEGQDFQSASWRVRARGAAYDWLSERVDKMPDNNAGWVWVVGQDQLLLEDPTLHRSIQWVDASVEQTFRHVTTRKMLLTGAGLGIPPVRRFLRRKGITGSQLERQLEDWRILPSTVQILDERNEVAVEAAVAERRDVAMVWGAGHLPGIDELLRGHGYELQHWRARKVYSEKLMVVAE